MKRFQPLFIIICLCFGSALYSQSFEDLNAPSFPAATIINSDANEISRPKSLKGFEAVLLNNFVDSTNNILVPNNFALEFNPYTLSKRKNFNYEDYINNYKGLKTLSFSLAANTTYKINDSTNIEAIGVGARMFILNGLPASFDSTKYQRLVAQYKKLTSYNSSLILRATAFIATKPEATIATDELKNALKKEGDQEELLNLIDLIFEDIDATINKNEIVEVLDTSIKTKSRNKTLEAFKTYLDKVKNERYGLIWEINGAVGIANAATITSPQQGIWSTFTYRPIKKDENGDNVPSPFEFTNLIRYTNINNDFIKGIDPYANAINLEQNFDIGLQTALDLDQFSLELEYIYRINSEKNTDKLLLNVGYNITNDILVSFNFGKDYHELYDTSKENLIAGLSVDFGFGTISKKSITDLFNNDLN
ncbi:hypothetical protein [Neptunitalea lumnitzerae]|uniref:Uncharacterized protein n=1 Tax=Neptunitalea lumnitzerae TaxID=2965509 RepID=A0ABQ5MEN8_9FLAO|nr:hypothetical protein [Neptunitalea sp. Y10]GLB47869.1 hypothetical protein Y10_02370 [Neptunitalea sp. Y10]